MQRIRDLVRFLVVIGALALGGHHAAAQSASPADSDYARLLGGVRAGDTTVDFQAFRLAYARTSTYDPVSPSRTALRERLNAALASEDLRGAALRADSLLADDYADINAHVIRSSLARQAGDSQTAAHHAAVARGLMRALDLEHRGTSPDNAIVIIDPDEENVYGLMTGLERTDKYTTAPCGERACDSTVFHDPRTGKDTTVVFDISLIAQKALRSKP